MSLLTVKSAGNQQISGVPLGYRPYTKNTNIDSITKIPSFCKPEDKHYPESDWPIYKGKPDFIFFDASYQPCGVVDDKISNN